MSNLGPSKDKFGTFWGVQGPPCSPSWLRLCCLLILKFYWLNFGCFHKCTGMQSTPPPTQAIFKSRFIRVKMRIWNYLVSDFGFCSKPEPESVVAFKVSKSHITLTYVNMTLIWIWHIDAYIESTFNSEMFPKISWATINFHLWFSSVRQEMDDMPVSPNNRERVVEIDKSLSSSEISCLVLFKLSGFKAHMLRFNEMFDFN